MDTEKTARGDTQRLKFDHRAIEKLAVPAEGRVHYYDRKESDLGLRVESSGRKSFFWYRSVAGRPTFKALGKFPGTDVESARTAARRWTAKLDRYREDNFEGPNPFETEGDVTFGELFDAYLEKHLRSHAANPVRAVKADTWMADKYLPGWRARNVKGITDGDVRRLHRDIGANHGKVSADRVVQMIRRVFKWGIEVEKMYGGANPCIGMKFYGHTSRERFLSQPELARLFTAMRTDPNRMLIDFISISLWTGARRGDVLSMRWQDIGLDDNVWRIPSPKGGEKHSYRVPLVPEAVAILRERQAAAAPGAVYVFPSRGATGHLVELKRGWSQLLKRAGIENLHIHDLRRTLGSWQAGLGFSLPIIGKSLGHAAGSSATAVYGRLDLEPVRAAVTAAVGAMVAASQQKPVKLKKNPQTTPALI